MLIGWKSGFGNNQPGVAEEILGTDGSILKSQTIRYTPQKVNRPAGLELVGKSITAPAAHLQDFLDCIRSGKEANCPFDLGYRVSIACRMAVESFLQRRTVRWDAQKEAIV
jgi:predicted dehydrogenase